MSDDKKLVQYILRSTDMPLGIPCPHWTRVQHKHATDMPKTVSDTPYSKSTKIKEKNAMSLPYPNFSYVSGKKSEIVLKN